MAKLQFRLVSTTYPGVEHTCDFGAYRNYNVANSFIPNGIVTQPGDDFVPATNILFSDMWINAGDAATMYIPNLNSNPDYKSGIQITLIHKTAGGNYYFSIYNREFGVGYFARTNDDKGLYLFLGTYASSQLNAAVSGEYGSFSKLNNRLVALYKMKDSAYRETMVDPRYAIFLPYTKILTSSEFFSVPTDWDPEGDNDYYCSCHMIMAEPTPNAIWQANTGGYRIAASMPGLSSLWNWLVMIYNKNILTTRYLEDIDGNKIYYAVVNSSSDEDYIRNNETIGGVSNIRAQLEMNIRDYQVGTNLSAKLLSSSDSIILKSGALIGSTQVSYGNVGANGRSFNVRMKLSKTVGNAEYKLEDSFDTTQGLSTAGCYGVYGDLVDHVRQVLEGNNLPTGLFDPGSNLHVFNNVYLLLYGNPKFSAATGINEYHKAGTTDYPNNENIGMAVPYAKVAFASPATQALQNLNGGDSGWGTFATNTLTTGAYYSTATGSTNPGRCIGYPTTNSVETITEWHNLLDSIEDNEAGEDTPWQDSGGEPPVPEPEGGDADLDNLDSDGVTGIDDAGIEGLGTGFFKVYHLAKGTAPTQLDRIHDWIMTRGVFDQKAAQYMAFVMNVMQLFTPFGVTPSGSTEFVKIADDYVLYDSSYISATLISKYIQEFLVGTIDIPEVYHSALDYAPYTKLSVYLPFVGVKSVNVNEFMGGKMYVTCAIDYTSGAITYSIRAIRGNVNSILYTFTGNCATCYPVTTEDYSAKISGIVNAIVGGASVVSAVATGGIAAVGMAAMGAMNAVNGANDAMQGSNAVRTGTLSSNAGILAHKKPYVIIERPNRKIDETEYGIINGYPSNVTVQLGTLSGYTKVKEVHLELPNATQDEYDQVEQFLKSGVIL